MKLGVLNCCHAVWQWIFGTFPDPILPQVMKLQKKLTHTCATLEASEAGCVNRDCELNSPSVPCYPCCRSHNDDKNSHDDHHDADR